jgi:pyruvate-formate lyase
MKIDIKWIIIADLAVLLTVVAVESVKLLRKYIALRKVRRALHKQYKDNKTTDAAADATADQMYVTVVGYALEYDEEAAKQRLPDIRELSKRLMEPKALEYMEKHYKNFDEFLDAAIMRTLSEHRIMLRQFPEDAVDGVPNDV